ncbi:MAG: hypothetical protein GY777_11990 [Candidatus Brocadiaceae bacterium]|nr:hypothetical protein [Candidatus Brocadiaceae bacterium]
MLKIITGFVCYFIMLSLSNLSFATGNKQPDRSLLVSCSGEALSSGVPDRFKLNYEFVQTGRIADNVLLTRMTETTENYFADSFSKPGYKPVPDECPYPDNGSKLYDNTKYKEWCEESFDDGKYVYDAYKDIAFNIKYTPEQAKTDIWQTPFETNRLQKGDCEDAVFLFSSHLSSGQENAMIIWGWVIDKRSRVGRAHVWHQLIDKAGQQYIVEGFSRDWNGIIPIEVAEKTELRKPIFTMTHTEVCKLASLTSRPDSWQTYQSLIDFCMSANFIEFYTKNLNASQGIDYLQNTYYGFIGHLLNAQNRSSKDKDTIAERYQTGYNVYPTLGKEVTNIFKKLYELFVRCNRQKEEFGQDMQIAYRSLVNTTTN